MNPEEHELSERFRSAIALFDRDSPRAQQSENFVVGMSELGFCSERTKRMLEGVTPDLVYSLDAFIGTAIGDHVEQAFCAIHPDAIRQAEVETKLLGDGGRVYTLPGHPDLLIPSEGLIIDGKTSHGLDLARRNGPSRQQQYQRHGYALGAWDGGFFPDFDLSALRVANVWFDRSGDDTEPHVHIEGFDQSILTEAAQWLDEVVYVYLNGGDAVKEPPRNVCEATCGHYRTCRMFDTDAEGLIMDPEQLSAIEMYQEGLSLERAGRTLKDQAKSVLYGVAGSTGEWIVRWVHVNESIIPESKRRAHDKISFTKVK